MRGRWLLFWLGAAIYLIWAIRSVPFDGGRIARGLERTGDFLAAFLQPDFLTRGSDIVEGLVQSLAMALVATALGALLAVGVALLASRGIAAAPLRAATRFALVAVRTFPELIIAIYAVAVFGYGPFAGFITLVISSVGFLAKLLADEIETMDRAAVEAIEAAGGGLLQRVRYAVLPAVLPRLVGLTLYRLDINFREASVIGIVGAGGIGATLRTALDRYEYGSASAILLLVIAVVLLVEAASGRIREGLVVGSRSEKTVSGSPWRGWLLSGGLGAALAASAWVILAETEPSYLLDAPIVLGDLLSRSFPPDFSILPKLWEPLADTIHIATLGTVLALLVGVPLAFLAARNTAPHPISRAFALTLAVGSRSVSSLVWALILVKLIGPGLLAGILAIGLRSVGFITKLLFEAIEEIRPDSVDAVRSCGAGRAAIFRYGVLPQVLPSAASVTLYRWDINIRESPVVGLVGAGGIGILLDAAVNQIAWREATTILVLIFILVLIAETIAGRLRRALA